MFTRLSRIFFAWLALTAQALAGSSLPPPNAGTVITTTNGIATLGVTTDPVLGPRRNGTPGQWVPICFRGRGLPGSSDTAVTSSSSVTFQDATVCQSPSWGEVIALRLVYAGFDEPPTGPQDRYVTITGAASIFYPSITFGAQSVGVTSSGSSTMVVNKSYAIQAGSVVTIQGQSGALLANTYVQSIQTISATGTTINTPNGTATVTLSSPTQQSIAAGSVVIFTGLSYPVRFGGQKKLLIEPTRSYIRSDPIYLDVAPNSQFSVATFGALSNGTPSTTVPFLLSTAGSNSGVTYLSGDSLVTGPSLTDNTIYAGPRATTLGSAKWGPVWVEGLMAGVQQPIIDVCGDSLALGVGDTTGDANGHVGIVARSLTNAISWIQNARGSTLAQQLVADNNGNTCFGATDGLNATDMLELHDRNDVIAVGYVATDVIANLQSLAARAHARGMKFSVATIPPFTSSTDNWATAVNQTIPSTLSQNGTTTREQERLSFNAALRNGGYLAFGFDHLVEWAAPAEDAANPGKWISNGTANYATPDGTHFAPAMVSLEVSNSVIPLSWFIR